MVQHATTDSLLVPETVVQPRTFAGLMSLYESNYLRLQRLIPELQHIDGAAVSVVDQDLPLHLTVTERSRYTCTLHLTYLFDRKDEGAVTDRVGAALQAERWLADPDLTLRVYFDGRLAEVMSVAAEHRHRVLRHIAASHREELDSRWRRNMMLNKWLDFLIDAGHQLGD
ncbi:MAG: DUF1249 domain-containing protein [Pseudomonadota bacterium]